MSEPGITNPKKTEKPKNPKRVEQGKLLAAISRQAKERKKQQQEKFFKPKESAEREVDKIFLGIGLFGAAFLAYKILLDPKKSEEEDEVPEAPANSQPEPPREPKPSESSAPTPRKPQGTAGTAGKIRGYEPYTMD